MVLNVKCFCLLDCPQSLALVLLRFIRTGLKSRLIRVCLRSLRILSRDKKVLGPLVTDSALLSVAKLAGLTTCDASDEVSDPDSDFYDNIIVSLAEAKLLQSHTDEDEGSNDANNQMEEGSAFDEDAKSDISTTNSADLDSISWFGSHRTSINEMHRGSIHQKVLERGRRDRRESKMEGEEEEEGGSGEEVQRKEALKVLCNVVYNSTWAQERFSALRWASSHKADKNMHTKQSKTVQTQLHNFTDYFLHVIIKMWTGYSKSLLDFSTLVRLNLLPRKIMSFNPHCVYISGKN